MWQMVTPKADPRRKQLSTILEANGGSTSKSDIADIIFRVCRHGARDASK